MLSVVRVVVSGRFAAIFFTCQVTVKSVGSMLEYVIRGGVRSFTRLSL
jgi:hypothetical protein